MVKRALLYVACAACAPDLPDDRSLVDEPRLLAARIEPPEVAPGEEVTTSALWVDPTGTLADAPLEWAFCTARKRLSEPGTVASACLVDASPDLAVFGAGLAATGIAPSSGCRQFGPDSPEPAPGETAGRPADPDGTGGFYQPIRVRVAEPEPHFALGQLRLRCGLPGATSTQAAEFRAGYVANTNPTIASVERGDGRPIVMFETDPTATTHVAPGEVVELTVRWPACDGPPCGGSEPYLWFDPSTRQLAVRREAMRVSWFATGGRFANGHTGRSESEADQPFALGAWSAPATQGDFHLWFVLRDDRGGVAWATSRFHVE